MDKDGSVEMRDAFGRFAMGVIASAVYGVDAKTFEDEQSEFVKNAQGLQNKLSLKLLFVFVMYSIIPSVAKAMKLRFMPMLRQKTPKEKNHYRVILR